MLDYEIVIKRLEDENGRVDTTFGQIEANNWRIQCLKLMNRPKPLESRYIRLDAISERLKDKSFTCAPNHLLNG